jgi:sortase (surface protein transpeptidase)
MAGLGIDTSVVTLSMTAEGDLGTPSDANRTRAGWFPSVLAGANRGTVLMDGHTYHDGSAIFDPSFKQQVRAGMVMRLSCTDGHSFSYRVAEVIVDLSPASYPTLVNSRNLYSASGPPQLVMITCTDYLPAQRVWANRAVVIATPIV